MGRTSRMPQGEKRDTIASWNPSQHSRCNPATRKGPASSEARRSAAWPEAKTMESKRCGEHSSTSVIARLDTCARESGDAELSHARWRFQGVVGVVWAAEG